MRGSIVDPRGRRKTWSVVIPVGKDPLTGRLRQQWKGGFKTKRGAEAYLNEVLPDVQNGTWTPPSQERFEAFAQRWLGLRGSDGAAHHARELRNDCPQASDP